MSQIYVANTDALVVIDGEHFPITKGVTMVREGHPLLDDGRDAMFGRIVPTYDLPDEEPEPTAAEVRAWAKANGVDVPAKGKLPREAFDAYKAAAAAQGGVEDAQKNLTVEDAARDLSGTATADQAGA